MDDIDYDSIVEDGMNQEPENSNKYDSIIENDLEQKKLNLKQTLDVSAQKDPERSRDVYNLSKSKDLPSSAVDRNLDKIKASDKSNEFKYDALFKSNPGLATYLSNPDQAAVSHKEIEPLKRVEQAAYKIRYNKKDKGLIESLPGAVGSGIDGLSMSAQFVLSAYNKGDNKSIAKSISESHLSQQKAIEEKPKFAKEFSRVTEQEGKEIDEAFSQFTGSYEEIKKGNVLEALKDFTVGGASTVYQVADLIGEAVIRPKGLIYSSTEQLANSFPSLVVGAAGAKLGAIAGTAVVPGAGTAIGGATGFGVGTFAGSILTEIGGSISEDLANKGVDLSDPKAIEAVLNDKKFMKGIIDRAERKGITTAAIDGLFNAFGGKALSGVKSGAKAAGKKASITALGKAGAKDVAIDAVGEGVGEFIGQVAKEEGLEGTSLGQAAIEATTSLGSSINDVAISTANKTRELYSGDTATATEDVVKDTQNALESIDEITALEDMGAAIKEAKTTSEATDAIKNLVESANEDGEASSVFFQSDDWDNYWTDKGESPLNKAYEISDEVGKSYSEASALGSDMEIGIGEYAQKVGTTEHFEGLLNKVKTRTDGMTLDQSRETMKNLPGLMKSLAEEANNIQDEDFLSSVKEVKSRVKDQLKLTGMSDKDAEVQAQLYEGNIKRRAMLRGKDPLELYKELNLGIKREGQQIIRDNTTYDDILKAKETQKKINKEQGIAEIEVDNLQGDAKIMAEEFISEELGQMLYEIKQSEAGSRKTIGYGKDKKVISTKSSFPAWFQEAGASRDQLEKAVKSKKGVVYNRLKDIATERLKNGYENQHSGQNMPAQEFRDLLGLRDPEMDKESFDLFQKEVIKNLNADSLGFYSKLSNEVSEMDFKAIPAKDLANRIKKLGGIKQDELDHTGIIDYLNAFDGKITKEEVQAYLNNNGLQIKEVTLYDKNTNGEANFDDFELSKYIDKEVEGLIGTYDLLVPENYSDDFEYVTVDELETDNGPLIEANINGSVEYIEYGSFQNFLDWFNEEYNLAGNGATKYKSYALDGGENYREVLLTLPTKAEKSKQSSEFTDFQKEMKEKYNEAAINSKTEMSEEDKARYSELLQKDKDFLETVENLPGDFKSSHFDQENILTHVRLSDFTDKDGKKILLADEIQSDWHQAGRKKGYGNPEEAKRIADIKREIKDMAKEISDLNDKKQEILESKFESKEFQDNKKKQEEIENSLSVASKESRELDTEFEIGISTPGSALTDKRAGELESRLSELRGISRAFRGELRRYQSKEDDLRVEYDKASTIESGLDKLTDKRTDLKKEMFALEAKDMIPDAPFKQTEAWTMLAFKRILAMAVAQGYDSVAWTPGQVHADRYNLSKTIDEITWSPGDKKLYAYDKRGNPIVENKIVDKSGLDDYVGKEVANKLTGSAIIKTGTQDNDDYYQLKGEDIKVGGEGMIGFYDKMLPKAVGKYIKKLDKSAKVGVDKVNTEVMGKDPIVARLGDGWYVTDEASESQIGPFNTREEAIESGKESTQDVWSVKLTDKLKEKISGGQTYFQGGRRNVKGWDLKDNETLQTFVPFKDTVKVVKVAKFHKRPSGFLQAQVNINNKMQNNYGKDFKNKHTGKKVNFSLDFMNQAVKSAYDIHKQASKTNRKKANGALDLHLAALRSLPSIVSESTFTTYQSETETTFYAALKSGKQDGVAKVDVERKKIDGVLQNIIKSVEIMPYKGKETSQITNRTDHQKDAAQKSKDQSSIPSLSLEMSITDLQSKVNAARQDSYFQGASQDPKGQIRIGSNSFNIDLLAKADPSTFIHETGHLFLEEMRMDYAFIMAQGEQQTDVQKRFIQDAETLLKHLGVNSFNDIATDQHELFARSFEAYLMEGKAPTKELQRAFSRFRAWLVSVYRSLKNLNAPLTDEVRGIMDRLLATEEEINAAQKEQAIKDIFQGDVKSKVDQKKLKKYEELRELFDNDAKDKMSINLAKSWKKEQEVYLNEEGKKIRVEAREALEEQRPYKALDILKNNPDIRVNKAELVSLYGEETVKKLPKTLYVTKGGYLLDHTSDLLGYETSKEMVEEFLKTPPITQATKLLAKSMIEERYPDLLVNQEKIKDLSQKFIHSDKRSEVLLMELSLLSDAEQTTMEEGVRKSTRRIPTSKQIKVEAETIISSVKVKSLRPHLYQQAEVREARRVEEFIAKRDWAKAFEAKQRELLNHQLYRQALEVKDKQKASLKKFKKINQKDEKLAKTRDISFINAARSILSNYDLVIAKEDASENMERIKDYDPDVYDMVTSIIESVQIPTQNYKELTSGEFQELNDVYDTLWDLSRSSKQIEIDGVKKDISEIVEVLNGKLETFKSKKPKEEYTRAKTKWELTYEGLLSLKSKFRRVEHWVEVMDQGDIGGLFRKVLFQNVSDATDQYYEVKTEYNKKIVELAKDIEIGEEPIFSEDLGHKFKDKSEILGAILHIGNDSNFKKLLVGREWGSIDDDGKLNTAKWDSFLAKMFDDGTITKKDMDFVQALWNLMEEIKPQAQKAHKKVYGFYFNEITANEFDTPFGKYKGGYAPAIVDYTIVRDAQRREEMKEFTENNPSYALPGSGGGGFGKSRQENYTRPLNLNINLVGRHIDDVLRFAIVKPEVINAAKIATNPDFREAMDQVDPTIIDGMIKPSLARADKNRRSDVNPDSPVLIKKGASYLQRVISANIMFGNVVNTVEQFTGFVLATTKIKPKSLFQGTAFYLKNSKEISAEIDKKSTFMRVKTDDTMYEMQKAVGDIFDNKNKFEKVKDFANKNTYFLQMLTQDFIDKIVWISAYNESIENGESEKNSITSADSLIRTTQNANRPQDIAAFQSAGWLNVVQMFTGYFNMVANVNVTNFTRLFHKDIGMGAKTQEALYLYATGYASLAILSAALRKVAAGGLDEDEDGEYLDDLWGVLVTSQFEFGMAMFPLVGQAVNAGVSRGDNKFYNDRMSASPVFEALSVTVDYAVPDAFSGEETFKKANVRDGLTALGVVTGLPLRPFAKPITYLQNVNEGTAQPSGPADFTRGLVTGKKGVNK